MEHLYIVVYKSGDSAPWRGLHEGEFYERRLAENFIECKRAQGYNWRFAIVDGPIVSPEGMAEAEARLGKF